MPDGPGFSSPPQDTQAFSQFPNVPSTLSDEVGDETEEGVWGYLIPLDQKYGKPLVLRKRNACLVPDRMDQDNKDAQKEEEEEAYDQTKLKGSPSGGYLIGRHPECGKSFSIFNKTKAELELARPHYRPSHCV